ncbi:MAG: YitT family protein [Pararoseburia sp.]|nr:YitT family protein [Pararoseburia sp.]
MTHKNIKRISSNDNLLKKIVVIVIGSIIAAYGITLALYAGFGGATLAVLWQGVSGTFHISIGMASFIVALGMILFAFIYDRSQIHVGTILYQIVYSACVDLFANCHIYSRYIWINFFIMLIGVVLFAVGTGLYASASLGRGSYEAVTFALAEKNNWQVKIVRMVLDIIMVVIGVLLGGKFGVCTIVTVLISGPIIQFVNRKSKQLLKV